MTTESQDQTQSPSASVPVIRSFEFDDTAVGSIKTSVNQYRGTLSLPIDFLTLEGRKGLDIKISALYSSNISHLIQTWNLEAPTGILGLGWSMPFEYILVDTGGNASPGSDRCYYVSNGNANPLICTGTTTNGLRTYQLQQYHFWSITYAPLTETWQITKEDGSVYTFGDSSSSANAIQWGVRWGNFSGSSSRLDGQERYARAWNLASVETVLGDTVTYQYQTTDVAVGSANGKTYTQASYVHQITDSLGRVITFIYGDKYGADNPSSQQIIEYQAAHTGKTAPNAYQDRYETLYLDAIEVSNAEGQQIHGLTFTYDFVNFAATTEPARNMMWKRVLKSVFQWSPEGRVLPSMSFDYEQSGTAVNPGALVGILYPGGGQTSLAYKELALHASRHHTITNPLTDARPGVWHGSDYVVTSFTASSGFRLQVSSWMGKWVTTDITPNAIRSATIDPETLWVSAGDDFLAVAGRDTSGNRDFLCLFRPDPSEFGTWVLDVQGVRWLALRSGTETRTVYAAGQDFVIAANINFSAGVYQGYSWDWQQQAWTTPALLPSSSLARTNGNTTLASFDTYYVAATWSASTSRLSFETFYRDVDRSWKSGSSWNTSNVTVVQEEGQTLLVTSAQSSYLTTTHVTAAGTDSLSYSVSVYQLDASFAALNGPSPKVLSATVPIEDDQAAYSVFQTVAAQNFVNSTLLNLRNAGGDQRSNTNGNWSDKTLSLTSDATPVVAAEMDVAAMAALSASGQSSTSILAYDPNQSGSTAWQMQGNVVQSGSAATVFGDYLTIGSIVYVRGTDGKWTALQQQLTSLSPQTSVKNRAPNYIAYQTSDDSKAQTLVAAPHNGSLGAPVTLPGGAQKITVPDDVSATGTELAGLRFLVSYPASEDFVTAKSLYLYDLDDGDISDISQDTPVAWVSIANPFDPSQDFVQSYVYANSSSSVVSYDTQTNVAQYPMVSLLPGVRQVTNTLPSVQPEGRTDTYFSNGLSSQASLPTPIGWSYNYDRVLNGIELAKKDYDSTGAQVAEQINYWKVFSTGPSQQNLYGAYARPVQTSTTRDGVTVTSQSTFDSDSGLETLQKQSYIDSSGVQKWLCTSRLYAYQVSDYQTAFTNRHYLTAVARIDRSVINDSTGTTTWIESRATTWKNWAEGTSGPSRLAKSGSWQWRTLQDEPDFDFASPSATDWIQELEIVSRTSTAFLVTEQRDVRKAPSSFLYDSQDRYLVATFPGGSLSAGTVSYWGAEPYENQNDWVLGRGVSIVPSSSTGEIDTHTGTHALSLAPGASGDAGLSRQWVVRQTGTLIASAWVKRPDGFDTAAGEAMMTILVNGQIVISSGFLNPTGEWLYLALPFTLTASVSEVIVRITNENTEAAVLVDSLVIAPGDCTWSATGFDQRLWLPDSKIEANGVTARIRYDPFGRTIFRTTGDDQLSEIATHYQSRDGNQGVFLTSDPNAVAVIQPQAGGPLTTFTQGGTWQQTWTPDDTTNWSIAGGYLSNAAATGTSSLTAVSTVDADLGMALGAQLVPLGSPIGDMSITIGDTVALTWSADTTNWTLNGQARETSVGADGKTPDKTVLFRMTLPTDVTAQQPLEDGFTGCLHPRILETFARNGIHIPHETAVIRRSGSDHHELHPTGSLYSYILRQDTNSDDITVTRVGGVWQLYVRGRTLIFRIDGQVIFSTILDTAISGPLRLSFAGHVKITDLALGYTPKAAVNFTDTIGNPLQQQGLETERMTVTQTLTDSMGRPAVSVKPIWIDGGQERALLTYQEDMASLDWSTGTMSGLVAATYPDDEGFPYSRETYETSPLGRVIASGLPGSDFAIGAHDTRVSYGTNDGTLGLNPGIYTRKTVTDPNGVPFITLSTTLGQHVWHASRRVEGQNVLTSVIFDDAGNPAEQRQPNYFDPPSGSSSSDWVVTQTFDFAGRPLTRQIGSSGQATLIYSDAGDLRFAQTPQGATEGTYLYWKYDRLGRAIESGYLTGTFDQTSLQDRAINDPTWPTDTLTWRKRQTWDSEDPDANAIGRISKVETSQDDDGTVSSSETYRYDLLGNTTCATQTISGTTEDRQTDTDFNSQGAPISIRYPADVEGTRWQISYRYDPLGRVASILQGDTDDTSEVLLSYTYQADGRPLSEHRPGDGTAPSERTYSFNSPLWPTGIRDSAAATDLFVEDLSYTSGGYQEAGYYGGQIARASYPNTASSTAYDFAYAYNDLSELETAECTAESEWGLGGAIPVRYDANGNMRAAGLGTREIEFDYVAQTQRLKTVLDVTDDDQIEVAAYTYNRNGTAISSRTVGTPFEPARQITYTIDPGISRTTSATIQDKGEINYRYGPTGQRILKDVPDDSGARNRTIYAYGVNGSALYEQSPQDETLYAYGPFGLSMVRYNGDVYYVLRDHLGSVRRLMDQSGKTVASFDYLPYGTVCGSSGNTQTATSRRFTGHRYDSDLGLYDTPSRFYSAQMGRFLSIDPMDQFDSPYTYAANNPVLFIDPDGMFSIGSLFSAIGGLIIGVVEVAIGVAIDVVAGVLEAVTGGLSTPVSVGLAAAAGTFYGAGSSAIIYSVLNVQDFDWKEYGITMGIGAVAGAISFGFGALGSAAAESVSAPTTLVNFMGEKAANAVTKAVTKVAFAAAGGATSSAVSTALTDVAHGKTPGFDVLTGAAWGAVSASLGAGIGGPKYKSGFKEFGKRVLVNVAKNEAIGVSVSVTKNAINGNRLDTGLVNTVVSGGVSGVTGSIMAKDAAKTETKEAIDFFASITL